ncbi:MAG: trimethylamine methyltransferase family protein [Anaerolineae bacterium]|jgi:trimethylamine--corrinoid protein Co-methyltransferase
MDSAIWKPQLTLLDRARIEELHGAATTILDRTGLNVHHEGLRLRLADAGARLGEGVRVYLPPALVEQALGTAKGDVVIYDRLGEPAMRLGPHQIYFGTGSDLIYTRDQETGERRKSTLDDVGRAARLCDALAEIDFVMSFALPSDVPNENAEPLQYQAIVENTIKPVIMTSFSGLEAFERMHEMACAIAGGDAAFRQRPNYILYGQFVSPLQHDHQALERLIFCAEKEIPLIYVPTIMSSASGPITLGGSLALATAESLAGLVMHQLLRPGAPFVFGACVSKMDMRTMLFPYGSPEWRLSDLVMAELSRYYGLPVFGTAGATDSKLVDAQAGIEVAGSLLVAALAGTNLIHDVGYLDSGLTGSLESIVSGADAIRWVRQFLDGMGVSEQTLALDVIDEIGPGGQFLGHAHTLQHLRKDMWLPLAINHETYDAWAANGAQDYATRARQYGRELANTHQPQPLDPSVAARLDELCTTP